MSVEKLHDLEQKRDNIARQMRSLNETIGDNEWSEEQREEFRGMKHDLQKLDGDIEIKRELRALDAQDAIFQNQRENEQRAKHDAGMDDAAYTAVFDKALRHGVQELSREERNLIQKRAQSIGDDTKGGYTVPNEFQTFVIEKMKAYGGISNNCFLLNTGNGRTLDWATTDGTSDIGAFVGEGTKVTTQDIDFGTTSIGAKKITSNAILISNELLQDNDVRMDSIIGERIATRIGRKEANAIVNGTGTGLENKGLAKMVTGTTPIAAAAKVGWKDLNALLHSIDPAYRNNNFAFAFNDNTLQLLENQEDGQGRPLWMPSVAGLAPETILGKKYFIDQAIADGGTTKQFIYAGDWKRLILRRVRYMTMKRLNELYAESDQTAFLAFHRFDTLLEDTSALKALTWKTA